jgi:hypothetical protein
MTVSIKQHFKHHPTQEEIELKRVMNAVQTDLAALKTTVANYKAIYDAHTHECPGSSFAASRCSTPDTGAAENSLTPSAASAFTDSSTANLVA